MLEHEGYYDEALLAIALQISSPICMRQCTVKLIFPYFITPVSNI